MQFCERGIAATGDGDGDGAQIEWVRPDRQTPNLRDNYYWILRIRMMTDRNENVTEIEPHNESADPFSDLASLRLSQDFHSQVGVKRALVRVPVRKPHRQEFVRVRDDAAVRLETGLLELKEDREFYLLAPEVRDQMPGDWVPVRLVTGITRQGVIFLWPLRLPDPDGRANSWHETGMQAAAMAHRQWVKVVADMSLGGYQVYTAVGELPEPDWPDFEFQRLLAVAFRDRFIRDLDHPVITRLLGHE